MKKSSLIVLFSLASLYTQVGEAQVKGPDTKTSKPAKKTTAPKASPSSVATAIPKNAEALGDGKYRVIDSSGTAWIYQESPFGITKTPEAEAKAQTAQSAPFGVIKTADAAKSAEGAQSSPFGASMTADVASKGQGGSTAGVTAFPNGDEIRFEKQSPFGKSTWTKKRSDPLNEVEKNALAAAEKTTAASGKN
jgi:hypothetical protein